MLICYGFSSSFCTVSRSLSALEALLEEGHEIIPLCSFHFAQIDTRFGRAEEIVRKIEALCGRKMIMTVKDAEPIGPVLAPDLMIIAPCTGNTLAKLRYGIFDTPLTLGAKAHLRRGAPLLLAFASNDGLSSNFENIAALYQRKNIFFVPLLQDDPKNKPNSLVCDFEKIPQAVKGAMAGKQLLPLFA